MERIAKKTAGGEIEAGRIKAEADGRFWVESEAGLFPARPAFGCLVRPMVRDRVLISRLPNDGAYILCILERETGGDASISLEGDLSLEAGGRLTLGGQELALSGEETHMRLGMSKVEARSLELTSRQVRGRIGTAFIIAEKIITSADWIVARAGRSFRWVRELDQTRAGRMTCMVKDALLLRSRRTSVLADEKVKVDADKILLG